MKRKQQQKNWTAYVFDFKKWIEVLYQDHISVDKLLFFYRTYQALTCPLRMDVVEPDFCDGEVMFLRYRNKPAISTVSPSGHPYVIPFCDPTGGVKGKALNPTTMFIPPPFEKRIKWDEPQVLFYPKYLATFGKIHEPSPYRVVEAAHVIAPSHKIARLDYIEAVREVGMSHPDLKIFNYFDQNTLTELTEEELESLIREKLDDANIPEFGSIAEIPPLQREMPAYMQASLEKVGYRTYQLEGPKPSVPEMTGEAAVIFDRQTHQYRVGFYAKGGRPPEGHVWTIKEHEDTMTLDMFEVAK